MNFAIDGIEMPKPSSWTTIRHIMTTDSERLVGSGRLVAPYLTTVLETEWKYKLLSEIDYDKLYDAYVLSCARNKSVEHTLTTIDSNSGQVVTYGIYTQSDFKAPLFRIKDGKRYYKDVTFNFVGLGGDE